MEETALERHPGPDCKIGGTFRVGTGAGHFIGEQSPHGLAEEEHSLRRRLPESDSGHRAHPLLFFTRS